MRNIKNKKENLKTKKVISAVIISFIIALLLFSFSATSIAYNDYFYNPQGNSVTASDWYDKLNNNYNLWCVQYGGELYNGKNATYNISKEYTVHDPIIEYIIGKGMEEKSNRKNSHENDPYQKALWYYLASSECSNTDKEIMTGTNNPPVYNSGNNNVITNARTYKEQLDKNNIPSVKTEVNGNDVTISIKGAFTEYELYVDGNRRLIGTKGKEDTATRKININGDGKHTIKVVNTNTKTYTKYNVKYKVLTNASYQRLITTSYTKEINNNETEVSVNINTKRYAVSLEKFVSKVNSTSVVNTDYDFNGKNGVNFEDINFVQEYASASLSDKENIKYQKISDYLGEHELEAMELVTKMQKELREGQVVDASPSCKIFNEKATGADKLCFQDKFKPNNPVKVEIGDVVQFKLRIRNNGTEEIKEITILEEFDSKQLRLDDVQGGSWPEGINNSGKGYINISMSLKPGEYKEIVLQFLIKDQKEEDILWNRAKIDYCEAEDGTTMLTSQTTYKDNDGTNNNADADCLIIQRYAVSLEKFVSKVENSPVISSYFDYNEDGVVDAKDVKILRDDETADRQKLINLQNMIRDGYNIGSECATDTRRYNDELENNNSGNHNPWKTENPVYVDRNDYVTYTIRLRNTGTAPIKITNITDEAESHYLAYKYIKIIDNNTDIGIDTDITNDINITYVNITLTNPPTLQPNQHLDIQITFSVKTEGGNLIKNKAKITRIVKEDGTEVNLEKDFDGINNNCDCDFIKTRIYAVSLEKFVSKVSVDNVDRAVVGSSNSYEATFYDYYDFNNDDIVDAKDVLELSKYIKEDNQDATIEQNISYYGDINNDNIINNTDLNLLKNKIRDGDNIKNESATNTRRYNDELENNNSGNHNPWKKNNPVKVNVGDFVTYTIRLRNTGETNIKIEEIKDICDSRLEYVSGRGISSYRNGTIKLSGVLVLKPGEYKDINIKFKVIGSTIGNEDYIINKAYIETIKNENDKEVYDSDGEPNNRDCDFIKVHEIKVSLEKYVSKVERNSTTIFDNTTNSTKRSGKAEYLTEKNGKYFDRTENDSKWTRHNEYKRNNVVEVQKGDKVTYTITVKNDSEKASVYITEIKDYLPDGVKYGTKEYEGGQYDINELTDNEITITRTAGTLLNPKGTTSVSITVEVIEPNNSLNILKNTAKITEIANINGIEMNADECDLTPYNNQDSDYIQMEDITISGYVWNDKALDKTGSKYDGLYNSGTAENLLPGIKVYLYRDGSSEAIASTFTSTSTVDKGRYSFDLEYIKGPKIVGTNRWAGTYYSYYVVFEYDGITYTSTEFADVTSNNAWDSNAKEDYGKVSEETRKKFNDKFSTINNSSRISYTTKNEKDYIPQSIHEYNSNMAMQSSTELINIGNVTEEQLKHVNLGLRGRDIFDLELTSDVYSTKVSVNGQSGTYNYGTNKVTLRRKDVNNKYTYKEDMASKYNNKQSIYDGNSYEQDIRRTDIQNKKYADTGLGIEVTYKITIQNTSSTAGTATKVTNYYDSKYTFVGAYETIANAENHIYELDIDDENSKDPNGKYGYKTIILPEKTLNQSEKMEIYVVYILNNAVNTLKDIEELPTYNMAEITEYKTYTTTYDDGTNNEATRGLIDKDSAPGNVTSKGVCLDELKEGSEKECKINLTKSTVEYYFGGDGLSKLKYEDDTYATPTLYFVSSVNQRKITGTVFEDYTKINSKLVKSGNGIKDEQEPGIKGITVELVENGIVRDTYYTNEEGYYEFLDFLPGNYTIRYYYGDTENTFLIKEPNQKSYNGEDFQATNNSFEVVGIAVNKLSITEKYWYLENEELGISTAKDHSIRRNLVSENVTAFSDEEMMSLNNARDSIQLENIGNKEDENSLIGKTYMYADTASMLFNVEKTNDPEKPISFSNYTVENMNFGIAEVPVTTIDLQKSVDSFYITDATGKNVIASLEKVDGEWVMSGDVIQIKNQSYDVSITDEKLQGANLQIKYAITSNIVREKNYDSKETDNVSIRGLVDIVNNNLAYNPDVNKNSDYWEVIDNGIASSLDISSYNTILKLRDDNDVITKLNRGEPLFITLGKVLSSTGSILEQIISSTVDIYEYNNIVEITGLNYEGVTQKDRIRTKDRYIIIPTVQHDTASSEIITIHPPTGTTSIDTIYYILAGISLLIIAAGVFGIKKYVLKK